MYSSKYHRYGHGIVAMQKENQDKHTLKLLTARLVEVGSILRGSSVVVKFSQHANHMETGFLKGTSETKRKGGAYCPEKLVVHPVARYKHTWVSVMVNHRIEATSVFKPKEPQYKHWPLSCGYYHL